MSKLSVEVKMRTQTLQEQRLGYFAISEISKEEMDPEHNESCLQMRVSCKSENQKMLDQKLFVWQKK